jgi:hypothetical protein
MARESVFAVGAVILSTVLCSCGKSPSAPSVPDNTQAAVIAETVGTVTMSALFNGGAQADIGSAASGPLGDRHEAVRCIASRRGRVVDVAAARRAEQRTRHSADANGRDVHTVNDDNATGVDQWIRRAR